MATLRAKKIYSDTDLILLLIEAVEFQPIKTTFGYQLIGSMKPIAVIVSNSNETYAFDMETNKKGLEDMKQSFSELDTLIAPFF